MSVCLSIPVYSCLSVCLSVLQFKVSSLGLSERARQKMIQLAGYRYKQETDTIRLDAGKYVYKLVQSYYYNYKVCDLIGHFVLASQGSLGHVHCTFIIEIMS